MNLFDIYQEGGRKALNRLAEAVGSDGAYLWQCATRWSSKGGKPKEPSAVLARKLIKADPRLTMDDLYGCRGGKEAA